MNHITTPRQQGAISTKTLITLAGAIALVLLLVNWLLATPRDGLDQYPHAFIAQPGYDASQITYVIAPIETPPPAPPQLAQAWQCVDTEFNDANGNPWIFPLVGGSEDGKIAAHAPVHPTLKKSPKLEDCRPYLSPEAKRQLDTYRERFK